MQNLQASQVKVLFEWQPLSSIQVHPQLSIQESKLGGIGLYFNGTEPVEDVVVARIPNSFTYNLQILMDILETLKTTNPQAADIIKTVLSSCTGANETEIIADFMFSFMIVLTNNLNTDDCPISASEYYLELLSKTNVGVLVGSEDDYLFEVEGKKLQLLNNKYTEIVTKFQEKGYILPSFDEFYHINKVTKSRVLEIPHAVDPNSDDYTVNTTLVPLLDFANHQHNNNAYFDVDRENNDVLLKYLGTGPEEICISYSDTTSIQSFVSTYGFIARAEEEIFEIKVNKDEINTYINEIQQTEGVRYDLIMKWLEIMPTIQLIKRGDKVGINYHKNHIPFWIIFNDNYRYMGWRDKLSPALVNDPDILIDNLQNLIEFQEDNCDVIQGLEKVAISPNEVDNINEPECIAKFNLFIRKICSRDIVVNDKLGLNDEYLEYKRRLFQYLISQDSHDLPYNPKWDDLFTYQPIVIYNYL